MSVEIESLVRLVNLRHLNIAFTTIEGNIKHLAENCKQLRYLSLSDKCCGDVSSLGNGLTQLNELIFPNRRCPINGDVSSFKTLLHLKKLVMKHCRHISGNMVSVANQLHRLRYLNVRDTHVIGKVEKLERYYRVSSTGVIGGKRKQERKFKKILLSRSGITYKEKYIDSDVAKLISHKISNYP
jgi:hypothetical protein